MTTTRICPPGLKYVPCEPPAALVTRLRAARDRHADYYRGATGTRLGTQALAAAILTEYLDRPRVWRSLVGQDHWYAGTKRVEREVLALMLPEDLVDRLTAIRDSRDEWRYVWVVTAILTAGLDRIDEWDERAAAGDRRAARQAARLVLSARRDLRFREAATTAA